MRNAKKSGEFQEDRLTIQQDLERRLAKNVSKAELAYEIATLLNSLGRRIDRIALAQRLASELASRFTHKSHALRTLIKYRPEQLAALTSSATWDELKTEVLPIIEAQKKSRAKVKTKEERLRRIKIAKNHYERFQRRHIITPGWIERDFAERSGLFLPNPFDPPPPTGPCLDGIFEGGTLKMCGRPDSLQSLFGLGRKRLSAAGPVIRRGRETFYDYRGVLRCMVALLRQTGPAAPWLPDLTRRRAVLTGILFHVRQVATPEIREAFTTVLVPYLN